MHQPKSSQPDKLAVSKPKILDETTREKMHKHLSDIHDVITEEDIQNVQIDIFRPYPSIHKPKPA